MRWSISALLAWQSETQKICPFNVQRIHFVENLNGKSSVLAPSSPLSALWVWYEIPENSFRNAKDSKRSRHGVTCIVHEEGRRVKPSSAFQQKVFQFLSAHQPCKLCAWNQPHLYRAKDVWQNIIWKQFLKSAFTPLRVSNLTANMSTFPKGSIWTAKHLSQNINLLKICFADVIYKAGRVG